MISSIYHCQRIISLFSIWSNPSSNLGSIFILVLTCNVVSYSSSWFILFLMIITTATGSYPSCPSLSGWATIVHSCHAPSSEVMLPHIKSCSLNVNQYGLDPSFFTLWDMVVTSGLEHVSVMHVNCLLISSPPVCVIFSLQLFRALAVFNYLI